LEFGDTTITWWLLLSKRRKCSAAVCPDIPAPNTTIRAMSLLLPSSVIQ
jgi:hypothetical protein